MDRLIYHNGSIIDLQEARIPVTTAGALYGWGVFTTLRVYGGRVFAFERHWERLSKHAERARVPFSYDRDALRGAVDELLSANNTAEGRMRITLLRGDAGAWTAGHGRDSEILIFTVAERHNAGVPAAITISPYRVSSHNPLAGIKRTAMLENVLALEEARSRKFTEAVMVNERGEIVGATAANIFWVEGTELVTPSPPTGCVAGVTRAFILEIAERRRIPVTEGGFPINRLLDASEVFMTSTAREITPVASFDIKQFNMRRNTVTRLLSREFQKLCRSARISG